MRRHFEGRHSNQPRQLLVCDTDVQGGLYRAPWEEAVVKRAKGMEQMSVGEDPFAVSYKPSS